MLKTLCFFGIVGFSILSGSPPSDNIQEIDNQINHLKDELDQNQLEEINREVESQSHFIGDWQAYGKDVEAIRENEKLANELKKQIEELETRKVELLRKKSSNK